MSGKLRVTLWFTLMVLLLAALVLIFLFVINGSAITDDPVGRLVEVVTDNAEDVEFDRGKFEWDDLDFYDSGVYCIYYSMDGERLRGACPENWEDGESLSADLVRSIDISGREYYLYDTYVDMELGGIWVRGLISADDSSGLMHTILILAAVLLPVILVITIAGGWIIASSVFRPMEKIVDAANSINDGNDLTARIGLKRGPKEMRKLGSAFDRMFEQLEKSFDAERQFTSDASHELRTPITVILAECDRAKRKDKTPEQFLKSVDVIEEQGHKMSELVQQLLGLTRLQHGTDRYPLRRGDLSLLVSSCCEEFVPDEERGISITSSVEPQVQASFNPSLISRVVQNLLQNACKYGREGGHVKLSLRRENGKAVLRVEDDGIGIAPEDQEKIFQRFWQADMSRGESGGSGLGLAMVKEIVNLHGGSISVDSSPGKGSVFTVII